jgi:2,3-bisphosphoglycerate-dependent phosphoglycerate mutase
MIKLVLLRHGESIWNRENRFTGWTDVPLTKRGEVQAKEAGRKLKKNGFQFDFVYTSYLKRAIDTMYLAMHEMKIHPKVYKTWRLNERHYGALQGLNKSEMAAKYGEKQILLWRRSYDVRPPSLTKDDARYPAKDPLYKNVPLKYLPLRECLKDTVARVLPYWTDDISPQLKKGRRIMIVAHGNSLRALVMHLDKVAPKDIVEYNIPVGIPLVYELDEMLKPNRHYYLASKAELRAAIDTVKKQGKAK